VFTPPAPSCDISSMQKHPSVFLVWLLLARARSPRIVQDMGRHLGRRFQPCSERNFSSPTLSWAEDGLALSIPPLVAWTLHIYRNWGLGRISFRKLGALAVGSLHPLGCEVNNSVW
jgi:hypothetical protein